jgi:hypothetical protein
MAVEQEKGERNMKGMTRKMTRKKTPGWEKSR